MDEHKKVELKHKRMMKSYLKQFKPAPKVDPIVQKLELEELKLEVAIDNEIEKTILGGGV